jgi:hypothetical protein
MDSIKKAVIGTLLVTAGFLAFIMTLCGGGYTLLLIFKLLSERSPDLEIVISMAGWSLSLMGIGSITLLWFRNHSLQIYLEKLKSTINPQGNNAINYVVFSISFLLLVIGIGSILLPLIKASFGDYSRTGILLLPMGWALFVILIGWVMLASLRKT